MLHEAYYLDAVQDEVMWRPMLDRAAEILEQQANPNYNLEMQSSLWKDIHSWCHGGYRRYKSQSCQRRKGWRGTSQLHIGVRCCG